MTRLSTHTWQVQCERRVVRAYPLIPHEENFFFLKVKYLKKFSQLKTEYLEWNCYGVDKIHVHSGNNYNLL